MKRGMLVAAGFATLLLTACDWQRTAREQREKRELSKDAQIAKFSAAYGQARDHNADLQKVLSEAISQTKAMEEQSIASKNETVWLRDALTAAQTKQEETSTLLVELKRRNQELAEEVSRLNSELTEAKSKIKQRK